MVTATSLTRGRHVIALPYQGWAPRAMVTAPLFAIALLAFELQKNYLTYGSVFKPPNIESGN